MPSFDRDSFRDLLLADLAVEEGLVQPSEVLALLEGRWRASGARPMGAESFAQALAAAADLEPRDVLRLSARADALIAATASSAEAALAPRAAASRVIPAALAARAGAGPAAGPAAVPGIEALPAMPTDRYADWTPIGEGGMGTVYEAYDRHLRRRVALKVIRAEALARAADADEVAAELLARFVREARLTARLEHPGILPVHEVGRTDDGRPYYAMRVMRGSRTLADALALARGPEARLALLEPFLKACDTMAYAHAQRVVHRDLKPQNVIVGPYGEVVVLDWGLAKALDDDGGPTHREVGGAGGGTPTHDVGEFSTQEGVLGTVGYLAPEGLNDDPTALGSASDVWSLGVILYEILTGELPFPHQGLVRYAEAVLHPPRRPSEREPSVPEALDALAMRALSKDPSVRPADAGALADAVRAWQGASRRARERAGRLAEARAALADAGGLPADAALRRVERATALLDAEGGAAAVEGVPAAAADAELAALRAEAEGARTRALAEREHAVRRRTVRRVGAVALAALAVGAGAFAWVVRDRNAALSDSLGRERTANERARESRGRANDLSNFMLVDLREKLWGVGKLSLLEAVADKARSVHAQVSPDAPADERRQAALALENTARVYEAMGRRDDALPLFDRILDMRRRLAAEDPLDLNVRGELGVALTGRGDLLLAAGRLSEALASIEEARAIRVPLAEQLGTPKALAGAFVAEQRLMLVHARRGEFTAARVQHDRAVSWAERWVAAAPADRAASRALAGELVQAGDFHAASPAADVVRSELDRAIDLLEENHARAPDDTEDTFALAQALARRQSFRVAAGDGARALADLERGTEILESLHAHDRSNGPWARALGLNHVRRAEMLLTRKKGREAEPFAARALEVWGPLASRSDADVEAWNDMGSLGFVRARVARQMSRWAEARALAEEGVIARRKALGLAPDRPDIAVALAWDLATLADLIAHHMDDDAEAARIWAESNGLFERHHALDSTVPAPDERDLLWQRCAEALATGRQDLTSTEHLQIASWMDGRGRAADAITHTLAALEDPAVRSNLGLGARWAGVRRAARAATHGGPDAERWLEKALELLREDVAARRAGIAAAGAELARSATPEERKRLEAEIGRLRGVLEEERAGHEDLASIRGDPRFLEIFPPDSK